MKDPPMASSRLALTANWNSGTARVSTPDGNLLTPQQAAEALALSVSWLAKLRLYGGGPPFLKLGRCVRYRREDLTKWLENKTRSSTSDADKILRGEQGLYMVIERLCK